MGSLRMLTARAIRSWILLFALTRLTAPVQAQLKSVESPLEISPYPAIVAYAQRHDIAVSGLELAPENSSPQPGDEVVYLLTLQQASGRTQWLARLTLRQLDPAKGDPTTLPTDTMYTSTGLELNYPNTPTALDLEFIGPFSASTDASSPIPMNRGHAVVSAESLQLGLVHYCESALPIAARMKAAGIDNPVYGGSSAKPKPEQIETGRKTVAAFGLTAEEERLAFSVYFALRSFYQACSDIPACRAVLEQVIQKPSVWSIARNLGVGVNFEYGWHLVQPAPAGDFSGGMPTYQLPLRLSANQTLGLQAALMVTNTRPPLRVCAGIVALVAAHPTDDTKRVFMRLLSARPAKR